MTVNPPFPKNAETAPDDAFDSLMMKRALASAAKGRGYVEPNPMVGCVIVKRGRIIGEGHHRRFGQAHAEIHALRHAGADARGADVYVTLEPCSHFGKTPPCCDALIDAGVARVIVATLDPNPLVNGRGLERLRQAGIDVRTGVLQAPAREMNAPFHVLTVLKRPYVIAKWAQSLDGKLATASGNSKWISCDTSRRQVHRLRGRVDAILVGSGTVLADDPLLTARGVRPRRVATRVVLDTRLRLPPDARLVQTAADVPTLVLTSPENARSPQADRLRALGVEVKGVRSARGRVSLRHVLTELARRRVTNLLVEGGPEILGAFFKARRVDEAIIYLHPMLVGDRSAPGPLEGWNPAGIAGALRPMSHVWRPSGVDLRGRMRFTRWGEA